MKTGGRNFIKTFALSLVIFFGAAKGVSRDPWWGKDKALHFAVSFISYNGFYTFTGKKEEAYVFTLSLGLFKELIDWKVRKTTFSYRDLIYDIAGASLAHFPNY